MTVTKKILVVDDDRASCELLREIFATQSWTTETAQTPAQATAAAVREKFDLIVSDVNLEADETGFDLLRRWRGEMPVILITGFGTLDAAVEASREGAWDFISKPFKVEEVIATARRAMERHSGEREKDDATDTAPYADANLLGRAPVMIELFKEIARVAPSRSTVLINGESGTGKELVARAIHQHSARAKQSFVPVNCGALTETLLEAELFGHMRGSFTGATADRKGLWEEAAGGTLFLDEIAETTPAMQVKLLRALQSGEIKRIGTARSVRVDVRVLAATNRDLEREVKEGNFREDLYYRLSAITLHVPPLRERRTDIPLLAKRFLRASCENTGKQLHFSPEALDALIAYKYPGNVRELEAAVEYAALRARGSEIEIEDLPLRIQAKDGRASGATARASLANLYNDLPPLDELERRYLMHVLGTVNNNRTRAAEILAIDRRTLYRMAERYGIKLDNE